MDIFIDNPHDSPEELGAKLASLSPDLQLIVITSKGLKIWPHCMIDAPYIHHCSCRFQSGDDISQLKPISHRSILNILEKFNDLGIDVIKTENLYQFDGKVGFSLAQGQ